MNKGNFYAVTQFEKKQISPSTDYIAPIRSAYTHENAEKIFPGIVRIFLVLRNKKISH